MTQPCALRRRGGRRLRELLLLLPLLTALGTAPPLEAAGNPAADEPPAGEAAESAAPLVVEERMTVTGSRLRGEPRELLEAPNNVTVISGERIDASPARTLQELLATEAGVILFDQVGDGVSTTFDLRGFGGTGTRVLLDGAPINDPRNNALALELVPLAALERVEIVRGSTAALVGGGSEAGVLNLLTRAGSEAAGGLRLAAGQDGTREAGGRAGGRARAADLFASGSWLETDGHRENGGGELARFAATARRDLGRGHLLTASLLAGRSELGNPGALTADELAADRAQAPFNQLDFSDEGARQATLDYRGAPGEALALSANLTYRDRDSEILSTGRAAPLFGGFFLDSDVETLGATVELRRRWGSDGRDAELVAGAEWLDGETDARGLFTSPADPGTVDAGGLGSDNLSERTTSALYLQGTWAPGPAWRVVAGARVDEDRVRYAERFPDPSSRDERTFSEVSLRAGVNYSPRQRWGVYLSYGESFLPPTIEELFAFPLFGSNPALEPEDSSSWEAGARLRVGRGAAAEAALFRIDTEDEILFDAASPLAPFGANVNGGRTRRQGVEASLRGPLGRRVRGFANLTLMEAEFLGRSDLAPGQPQPPRAGKALPLVPEQRLALGLDADLPRGFAVHATWLHVGEQPLDNDDANVRPPLPSYSVLDARLSWRPRERGAWSLFLDAHNLLDEEYSTRGIFAFDFGTFESRDFFTPAPDRRVSAGVRWEL